MRKPPIRACGRGCGRASGVAATLQAPPSSRLDGYAGADADVFCERWTVLNAHRATPSADRQAVKIFRQLFDEAIAELDRKQPRRR